ncbi:3-oxoacyl-ACP reductase [Sphaerisporangium melleum]|uniref:3-oxoacyl-ACP reductase n=1 Tax=Sphaerisporangium melleum TaxID=321316 RepID=A0A917RF13_9ACTN|nr:SDR family oxidoreductase [Sphaerisporangium melleum]GGL05120.1 3-oxoacyl-ACP reductase [Sphaerisporangium melleum]GII73932.1 3-oxoacyl-ACP reductase [Sphaerisporangium melleum]
MTRTVVVTGGGTGIGYAVAAAFAAEGAQVFITGRRQSVLSEAAARLGEGARTLVCDATDPDQIEALRDQLPTTVDVLVNNAGGNRDLDTPAGPQRLGAVGLSGQSGPDDLHALAASWRANMEGNLVSAVLMTAALNKQLAPGGAVVHIGSFAADRGAGSYGAAKAGLNSWNTFLARQLGARDITSNVVAPGYIADTEFFRDKGGEQFHQARVAETMNGRAGYPEDIAGTVVFLASPAARHITGQVINVNGGAVTTR